MIQDKSTRFTLFATSLFLVALVIIGWGLSRTAADKKSSLGTSEVVAPVPVVSPVLPVPSAEAVKPAPSLPLGPDGKPSADYQVLTEVALVEDAANDGDTFLLKTTEGTHRFCLYFVDTVDRKSVV